MNIHLFRRLLLCNIPRQHIFRNITLPKNNRLHGIDVLRDPSINKGTAFGLKERQLLGIHGLLPPAVLSLDEQVNKIMGNLRLLEDNLHRYSYLISLQDRNERLFYQVITNNVEYCMPRIYTPTVGLACQNYGTVLRRPRGIYITIHDCNHIMSILDNWPEEDVKAIVVTDGERILGLGDLGAYGMGIPIGKLSLYTALAGVNPKHCLPVMLDVGTDNEILLNDPVYTGTRHKRIRDGRYEELIDNFMKAVVVKYGHECLIQFEDFANNNAFRLLERYQETHCVFNDDIQGTAAVTVAGLLASSRITNRKLMDHKFLFVGAGEAATGIASLLVRLLMTAGLTESEAYNHIFMFDKDGLLVQNDGVSNNLPHNSAYARKDMPHITSLLDAVRQCQPTTLIGVSGVGKLFTPEVLHQMAQNVERPVIFALSNPTSQSECTAEEAYSHTQGRCVFASGSPFDSVTLDIGGSQVTFSPGQCNNSYIFPGVSLAITTCRIRPVSNELFAQAAQSLADLVSDDDIKVGRVYPPLNTIRSVSLRIAEQIAECAYRKQMAHLYPKPSDICSYLLQQMYDPQYSDSIPNVYDWPPEAFGKVPTRSGCK